MGLFSKKNNEYKAASRNLNQTQLAAEKLVMEKLKDDDQRAAELVDLLKEGTPLILNFEDLTEEEDNKMLAFFAGAAYALDGKSIKINETTYLFARKVEFMDGSLQSFIQSIPKR
jgi:FtsZ-interacting cell division protein YlmF